MHPERPAPQAADRGSEVETTLWRVVAHLRARAWRVSMWEIQRAQDVIAYLFARPGRPPTDDELRRYLAPIFCGRESDLAVFAEAFQDSLRAAALPDATILTPRPRRRVWLAAFAAAVLFWLVFALFNLAGSTAVTNVFGWDAWWGWFVVVAVAAVGLTVTWVVLHKRFRRRPAPLDRGRGLELRWAAANPLDPVQCGRIARALRARTREPGTALDIPRTVDASIRAGLKFKPRFVQHKRAPEYLAVIEQRSAQDVLAAYHAKAVDQIGAQGVAMRRVGIQPSAQQILDPVRGRRNLETLQPLSERERLLLFAHGRTLRNPLTNQARPWLAHFDQWSETIRIGPGSAPDRSRPVVDNALGDVRRLDRGGPTSSRARSATRELPAVFEADDLLWIEACAPSETEVARALDLLGTALGPSGWFWLSACALYPEINYDLTVALGNLLREVDGRPVAADVDMSLLARLPWFRHGYMPDWLRTTLIGSMSRDQLIEARAVLGRILVSGLLGVTHASSVASVAARGRRVARVLGRRSAPRASILHDQVYLDGMALRRRHLAAAAPPKLVGALRRQRSRQAAGGPIRPPARWVLSIISFWLNFPFGCIALYYSYQVIRRFGAREYDGAVRASRKALTWALVAIFSGVIAFVLVSASG